MNIVIKSQCYEAFPTTSSQPFGQEVYKNKLKCTKELYRSNKKNIVISRPT